MTATLPPRQTPKRQVPRSAPAGGSRGGHSRSLSDHPLVKYRTGSSKARAAWLSVMVLMVMSIFAGRLFELQVIDGKGLAEKAKGARLTESTILADRGSIFDRNGQELATTVEMRNITADQVNVTDPAAAAATLSPLLNMPVADLQRILTGTKRFTYVKKGVTPEIWRKIVEAGVPGIYSERTTARYYPGGTLAANVLGFVDASGKGAAGVELAQQKILAGTDGYRTYEQSIAGQAIPTGEREYVAPTPGSSVRLTLDRDIQYVAQEAITRQVAAYSAESGNIVVMRPNGEILAMATAPTFDPNNFAKADKALLGNRVVGEIYEPGSTGKILTMSAVLEEKKAKPSSAFTVPPVLPRAGHVFNDHDEHGTLNVTLTGILARSSNIGTILAADRIGPRKLSEYVTKFGLGAKTGVGLPGEEKGIVPAYDSWGGTTFPSIAYGQAYSVTGLQQATVFATIANGGVRPVPRIFDGVYAADGTFTELAKEPGVRVVSAKTAKTVATMMQSVVYDGTAPGAKIPGYTVGGKTGTAERADSRCGCYRGTSTSFIGIAPADNPEVVVSVTLHAPKTSHGGGVTAAPLFKEVTSYALQTLRVPPTGAEPARWSITPGVDPRKSD